MSQYSNVEQTGIGAPPVNPVMREVAGKVDFANLPTEELLTRFWDFMRSPLSDVSIALANAKVSGLTVPQDLGALGPMVDTALGFRKAHGRNISPETVKRDLGVDIPEGYVPSFTLYLQAARIRPDDAVERMVANAIKNGVRKHIRAIRK